MADSLKSLLGAAPPGTENGSRADETAAPGREASRLARRQRMVLWTACATAVLSVLGLVTSTWLKSPAQIAAETKPPKASVLTATVEEKVLKRTVVSRGAFSPARMVDFTPPGVLTPDGRDKGGDDLIVTRVRRRPGDKIESGSVLAEVSYRPVFVLRGALPLIRDLTEGQTGPDVSQLQKGLADAGYSSAPDEDDEFGPGTARAVRGLYSAIGYPVPTVAAGPAPGDDGGEDGKDPQKEAPAEPAVKRRVVVPKSELMFVPSFPARVSDLRARPGDKVSGKLISVVVGGVKLVAELDPSFGGSVKEGQSADVVVESSGRKLRGRVAKVGTAITPKAKGAESRPPYIPLTIEGDQPWNSTLNGEDVTVTITASATDGKVLAVPQGAIGASADGRTSVTVVSRSGERRRVQVTAGLSADGFVEVVPEGGALKAGDDVIVGR